MTIDEIKSLIAWADAADAIETQWTANANKYAAAGICNPDADAAAARAKAAAAAAHKALRDATGA